MLHNGEMFPALDIPDVGGGTISLPGDLDGSWGVVLIYRGAWCPVCNAQLTAFAQATGKFEELGIKVIAFSVDDEATTAELVEKLRLTFPVGHSADADKIAEATRGYTNDDPHYLQPAGFVLAADGTIALAAYSSGAIGRLTADEVAGFVGHAQSSS